MDFLTIILTLIISFLGIHLFFYRKVYTFYQAGIPYLTPWPIFGNLTGLILKKTSLSQLLKDIYNLNPQAKYVGFFEFSTPVILIRDPELVKSITIKNFDTFTNRRGFADESEDKFVSMELFSAKDENWHKVRNLISPSFTSSKMRIMFTTVANKSEQLVNQIVKKEVNEIEMKTLFQRLVTDIMASCAFGVNSNCIDNEKDQFYLIGKDAANLEKLNWKKLLLKNLPFVWKLLGMSFVEKHVVEHFKNIVVNAIEIKKEEKKIQPNIMHLLISSIDENVNNDGKEMSVDHITMEATMFFMASLVTSSEIFTYFFYEIAINPEIQEKLHNEIDSFISNKSKESENEGDINDENETNQKITFQDINNLKFLDATLKETLRLHTTIMFLERVCSKNFVLPPSTPDSKTFTLEPGMLLWIPSEAIHHDPNNYNDPEKFNPERFFNKQEKLGLSEPTFLPFGIGPRRCIAYRFAMLIFKAVIFHLLSRCSVKVCSKTPNSLYRMNTLTKVSKEIWLQIVERRTSNVN